MHYAYFVPRNTNKLTTRGGTSPDGVEMTLIRERKSTHRLGTRLVSVCLVADTGTKLGCSRFARSHTVMNVPNVLSESLRNTCLSQRREFPPENLSMACRAAIFTKLKTVSCCVRRFPSLSTCVREQIIPNFLSVSVQTS